MNFFPPHLNPVPHSLRTLKRFANAARGRALWQTRQLRAETMTLGNPKAAWTILRRPLPATSVIYSLGVGEDISFDLELIERFGVTVHAFDPTPRSIEWLKHQTVPAQFVFHPVGVGAIDGTSKLSPPRDPRHVSHRLIHEEASRPAREMPMREVTTSEVSTIEMPTIEASTIEVPVSRLTTLARMLGHGRIDLLKMDIEGSEYDVISDLVNSRIRVDQLLIEFHHRWPEVGLGKTKQAIRSLNARGFEIFSVSPSGEEFSFLNRTQ
jgi:FkbM family methyltransferase